MAATTAVGAFVDTTVLRAAEPYRLPCQQSDGRSPFPPLPKSRRSQGPRRRNATSPVLTRLATSDIPCGTQLEPTDFPIVMVMWPNITAAYGLRDGREPYWRSVVEPVVGHISGNDTVPFTWTMTYLLPLFPASSKNVPALIHGFTEAHTGNCSNFLPQGTLPPRLSAPGLLRKSCGSALHQLCR